MAGLSTARVSRLRARRLAPRILNGQSLRECVGCHYDQIHCVSSGGTLCDRYDVCGRTRRLLKESRKRSEGLTADQKTKMDAIMAEHEKAGCTEASEAKYMQEAKGILTNEQYAKFEAQCKKGEKDKTQT